MQNCINWPNKSGQNKPTILPECLILSKLKYIFMAFQLHTHTYIHTHTHAHAHIRIYITPSLSSSRHADRPNSFYSLSLSFSFSLTIRSYRPSLLLRSVDGIQCPHRVDECMFWLPTFMCLYEVVCRRTS